jgi:hypothetical protein
VLVACGADGVVEIDASNPQSPRRSGRMPIDSGEATGLFVRDGRVWVEIAHMEARPVRVQQGAAAEAPGPSAAAPLLPLAPTPAATSIPESRPQEPAPRSSSILAPPRRGELWELSAAIGGFVNLGPVGGGGFGWASAAYRFALPIVIRAELAPVLFGFESHPIYTTTPQGLTTSTGQTASSSAFLGAGQVLVGLDTQFVEVALGAGASSVNPNYFSNRSSGGLAIVEEGRFGARDGLALSIEVSTVAANDQTQLGFFEMDLQVPISRSVMLTARGGGGGVGLIFGDLGARYVLRGDGGPDTVAIKGFFGGAGIDHQACGTNFGQQGCNYDYISIGGPSVGGGIEWRR